jgi:uncharacterized protein YndB with AHSA1/START domain
MTTGIKSPRLVERAVKISAPPEDVWRAIVEPELGAQWMGMRILCDWQIGSTILLTETPLGPDYREQGKLLDFEPGRLLRYDHYSSLWRIPDHPSSRAVVSLELDADGSATRVLFRHELPIVEAIAEHSDLFWRVGLEQLKALFERRSPSGTSDEADPRAR